MIEVRDSRTGYLIPARDGPGALPDLESSWAVAAAAARLAPRGRRQRPRRPPARPNTQSIGSDTQNMSFETQKLSFEIPN